MNDAKETQNLNKFSHETYEKSNLMTEKKNTNNNDTNAKNNKLSQEKFQFVKSIIKESLCNSLAQASIKFHQTKHLKLKMFLLFAIINLNTLALYMVIQSIISYLHYEVITTSRTIYETPTLFPTVAICNQNMLQNE